MRIFFLLRTSVDLSHIQVHLVGAAVLEASAPISMSFRGA